jgi:hypothetical protein
MNHCLPERLSGRWFPVRAKRIATATREVGILMARISVIIGSVLVAGAVCVPATSALAHTHTSPAVAGCPSDAPPLPLPLPGAGDSPSASPKPSEPGNSGGGGATEPGNGPSGGGAAVPSSAHCPGA